MGSPALAEEELIGALLAAVSLAVCAAAALPPRLRYLSVVLVVALAGQTVLLRAADQIATSPTSPPS